jgi:AAA+ superfamily predicted ATPase
LQKNTFVEVSRADLVGQYQGHTAQLVMNKLEEADGGILFIDEAYTLTNGDNDNFGQEAIQTLVAELENRRSHLMVILAGYPKEMSEFLNVNSGLASRLSNEVYFADYTPEELTKIFFHMAKKRGLMVDELPEDQVREWIVSHKENQRDFGNARGVRNLLDTAMRKKDSRIAAMIRNGEALTDEAITMLTVEDLQ